MLSGGNTETKNSVDTRISPALKESQTQPQAKRSGRLRIAVATICVAFVFAGSLAWGVGTFAPSFAPSAEPSSAPANTQTKNAFSFAAAGFDSVWQTVADVATSSLFDEEANEGNQGLAESQDVTETPDGNAPESAETSTEVPTADDVAQAANDVSADDSIEQQPAEEYVVEWIPQEHIETVYEYGTPAFSSTPGAQQPTLTPAPESSSSAQSSPPAVQPASIVVHVVVSSAQADNQVQANTQVQLQQGASAYDALVATGLPVNARNTQYGVYVAGIAGLVEKQYGGASGWLYAVNGITPGFSAASYELASGDTVEWFYTV